MMDAHEEKLLADLSDLTDRQAREIYRLRESNAGLLAALQGLLNAKDGPSLVRLRAKERAIAAIAKERGELDNLEATS